MTPKLAKLAMEVQDIAADLRFEGTRGATEKKAENIGVEEYTSLGDVISDYLRQIAEKAFGRRSIIESGSGMVMVENELVNPSEPGEQDVYQVKIELSGNGTLGVDIVYIGGALAGKRGRVLSIGFRDLVSMDQDQLYDKVVGAVKNRVYYRQGDTPSLEAPPQ